MKKHAITCAAFAVLAFIIAGAAASAALKAGDQLVYTVHMSQAHNGPSVDSKLTLNVDRADKDGTAHANVALDSLHMPSLKAEATVSRSGEIVAKTVPIKSDAAALNPVRSASAA